MTVLCIKEVRNHSAEPFWDFHKAVLEVCPHGKASCEECLHNVFALVERSIEAKIYANARRISL